MPRYMLIIPLLFIAVGAVVAIIAAANIGIL